jgi:hypothetical protein
VNPIRRRPVQHRPRVIANVPPRQERFKSFRRAVAQWRDEADAGDDGDWLHANDAADYRGRGCFVYRCGERGGGLAELSARRGRASTFVAELDHRDCPAAL